MINNVNNINSKKQINNIVTIGLMTTLVFLGTYFMRLEVSLFGNHVMIHMGNMFCLLGALLFGKRCGALSGAIGMSLFDIVSGRFIIYFPFVFILKYVMGYVCGYIKTKRIGKLDKDKMNLVAVVVALLINIVFSPWISMIINLFFYKIDFYVSLANIMGSIMSVIITSSLSGFLVLILVKILEPVILKKE